MKWVEDNEAASELQDKSKDYQSTTKSSWIQFEKVSLRVWVISQEDLVNAVKHQKLWIERRRKRKVVRPDAKRTGEAKRHHHQRLKHSWKR